jgi:hypothetical protein
MYNREKHNNKKTPSIHEITMQTLQIPINLLHEGGGEGHWEGVLTLATTCCSWS